MSYFIAGCFFGSLVTIAARIAHKPISRVEERMGKVFSNSKPIVVEGNDPVQDLIDREFDVKS